MTTVWAATIDFVKYEHDYQVTSIRESKEEALGAALLVIAERGQLLPCTIRAVQMSNKEIGGGVDVVMHNMRIQALGDLSND